MNHRLPIAVVAAAGCLLAGSAGSLAAEQDDPPALPEEFTVCVPSNSATHTGTDDVWDVPSPDGDVVIEQGTGTTFRGTATSSDPRFEGTHYHAEAGAEYNYEGGGGDDDSGPEVGTFTDRFQNDEGAWQGSVLRLAIPDDTPEDGRTESSYGPFVLIGEGAYEGLTAVLMGVEGSCFWSFQGYVMEVPAFPVPYTGE
jgi:hypothetical protein